MRPVTGPYASPYPDQRAGTSWVGALLLVLAAVLAVSGSFATLFVYRVESLGGAPAVQSGTAWREISTEAPPEFAQATPPIGIPLVVAAVLAVVAAFLLLRSTATGIDSVRGRILGTGAAGLLVGSVAVVWIQQLTLDRNAAANTSAITDRLGADISFRTTFDLGAGAYLLLVAALLALGAAVILLGGSGKGAAPVPPHPPYPAAQQQQPPGPAAGA